jgi:hypothetical protein
MYSARNSGTLTHSGGHADSITFSNIRKLSITTAAFA